MKRAMLRILLDTCETTMQAFEAADNSMDEDLAAALERMIERTKHELATVTGQIEETSKRSTASGTARAR